MKFIPGSCSECKCPCTRRGCLRTYDHFTFTLTDHLAFYPYKILRKGEVYKAPTREEVLRRMEQCVSAWERSLEEKPSRCYYLFCHICKTGSASKWKIFCARFWFLLSKHWLSVAGAVLCTVLVMLWILLPLFF